MSKIIVIACLLCFVAAVPVPDGRPKSIELIKIPLKGDKVSSSLILSMKSFVFNYLLHLFYKNVLIHFFIIFIYFVKVQIFLLGFT